MSLFGLKLVRVLTTIVGLVLGAGVGLVISHLLGWSGLTVAIVCLLYTSEPNAMKLITAVLFLVILILSMERKRKAE